MKDAKPLIVILVIVCLALGAGLFMGYRTYQEEKKSDERRIQDLSTNWSKTSADLVESQKSNNVLQTNVVELTQELGVKSNEVVKLTVQLAKTEADAKAAAQTAREELDKRDAKITQLETEREDMNKRMGELNTSIASLEKDIETTERKLQFAEGDRAFLIKELKRLQTEKSELERQFNDLALLRDQVRRLRDDLSIAKRLEWLRRGLYGSTLKGGERIQKGFTEPGATTNYGLNVELRQDGSVNVGGTNAPRLNQASPGMSVTVSTNAPASVSTNAPAVEK